MIDKQQALLKQFELEVYNKSDEIDPGDEKDWYSITLGWAIGKGETPAKAHDFVRYVRYSTKLG